MKKALAAFICVFLCLGNGCGKSANRAAETPVPDEFMLLRAQVAKMVLQFRSENNPKFLEDALMINERVVLGNRMQADIDVRMHIMFLMGRNKEGFIAMDGLINKDERSPDRLMYNALKYKFMGEAAIAHEYFGKAWQAADDALLKNPEDIDSISVKINICVFTSEKEKAKELINKAYAIQPDNEYWRIAYLEFDKVFESINKMYSGIELP